MITLRRHHERQRHRRRKEDTWSTFFAQEGVLPFADGFGILEVLNENRLPPGGTLPRHPPYGAEVVTYVCEGALAYEDATGSLGVIRAGEFRRRSGRPDVSRSDANAQRSEWAHAFQIGLRCTEAERNPTPDQKRFSAAERRGLLRIVASPDARSGSLSLREDALMYSGMLDSGHHLVHEISLHRTAWLHVVHGEVTLSGTVLTTGDGAGFSAERGVSLTAREPTEVLLVDLGEQLPRSREEWRGP